MIFQGFLSDISRIEKDEVVKKDCGGNAKDCTKARFPLGEFVRATRSETRIRQRDWLKLAGEKIRREQVGTVPTFCLFARTNSPIGKRA